MKMEFDGLYNLRLMYIFYFSSAKEGRRMSLGCIVSGYPKTLDISASYFWWLKNFWSIFYKDDISNPGRTNTQGLYITEKKVLPLK